MLSCLCVLGEVESILAWCLKKDKKKLDYITYAGVQQVCKPLRQVCFDNTAVTAKIANGLELMMCRNVLGHIPRGV